jgi:hypothetical protein
MDDDGDFVVAWEGYSGYFYTGETIFARRFDRTGAPIDAGELQVNPFTGGG